MSAIPLGMLLNVAFLGVWRIWPIRAGDRPTALVETLGLSLGFWIAGALLLVVVREALTPNMTRDVLVGVVALVVTVFLGARARRNALHPPKETAGWALACCCFAASAAGAAIACGVAAGSCGVDDRRRDGIGVPSHLFNQHVGNMDGPRQSGSHWGFWADDAGFGGRFDLCLGMCLQHAVDRPFGRIDFGVDCRLGLRLTSGLPLAEKSHTGHLINMNCHWLSFR